MDSIRHTRSRNQNFRPAFSSIQDEINLQTEPSTILKASAAAHARSSKWWGACQTQALKQNFEQTIGQTQQRPRTTMLDSRAGTPTLTSKNAPFQTDFLVPMHSIKVLTETLEKPKIIRSPTLLSKKLTFDNHLFSP